MPMFRLVWEIDIYAETPKEAAQIAQDMQRNSNAWVGVFDVTNVDGTVRIDLDEDPEDADANQKKGLTNA